MTVCKKCGDDLPETDFPPHKQTKNGLSPWCRTCTAAYNQAYRAKHRQKLIQRSRQYQLDNKEKVTQYQHNLYVEQKKQRLAYKHAYYAAHKTEIKQKEAAYKRKRYAADPRFATIVRLRSAFLKAFKNYSTTGKAKPSKAYGINWEAIFRHLGPCPGNMSDYHIDHIVPLCAFDHDDPEQIKKAWAPENHQWLPAEENLRKNASLDYIQSVIVSGRD